MGFSLLRPYHVQGAAGNTGLQGTKSHSTILSLLITPLPPWPLEEGGSEQLPPAGPEGK